MTEIKIASMLQRVTYQGSWKTRSVLKINRIIEYLFRTYRQRLIRRPPLKAWHNYMDEYLFRTISSGYKQRHVRRSLPKAWHNNIIFFVHKMAGGKMY